MGISADSGGIMNTPYDLESGQAQHPPEGFCDI